MMVRDMRLMYCQNLASNETLYKIDTYVFVVVVECVLWCIWGVVGDCGVGVVGLHDYMKF